jgi:PAS domain S-box-containing protein
LIGAAGAATVGFTPLVTFIAATDDVRPAGVPDTAGSGWASLFWQAFRRSRNAMALLDEHRRHVDVNGAYLQLFGYRRRALVGRPVYEFIDHGPLLTPEQWRQALGRPQFHGVVDAIRHDGEKVSVEFAGHPEFVTGRQLILVVILRAVRAGRRRREDAGGVPSASLSKREREVVNLLSNGATGPEIAEELHVSHNTVRTHVHNAMTKMGARSRAQLVAMSMGSGHAFG